MLAAALAGERSVYESYAGRATLLQPVAATGRHYGGTFWSSLRTDAMRLSLAEDVRPGDATLEPLVLKVASSVQTQRYLTTQEAAWAVSALGKRAQRFRGADVSNIALQVQGRTVLPTLRQKDIPMWLFFGPAIMGQTLKVVPASDPAPFVYVKMRGYRRDLAAVSAEPVPFSLRRRYLDLRGELLPPQGFVQGQLAVVELTLESTAAEDIPNVAIVDRLPAGLEIENPRLGREHRLDWMPQEGVFEPDYLDLRDNRMQIFGTLPKRAYRAAHSTSRFYYVVRAVTAGAFTAPPAMLEIMYDPDKVYYTEAVRVTVTPR
jgi:alpha-2-macroglobulin